MHDRVSQNAFFRRGRVTLSRPRVSVSSFDAETSTLHGQMSQASQGQEYFEHGTKYKSMVSRLCSLLWAYSFMLHWIHDC